MRDRPYTLLSCALSIDGYLGRASPPRLELSNDADFDRVDAVRASCDAILVGATTVRHDNPRLLIRSEARREARRARGMTASPIKVTVTGRGELDPDAHFFAAGDAEKLVYCTSERAFDARSRLGPVATVRHGASITMLDIVMVVYMTAKLGMASKPRASTNEDTVREPFRTVIAVGSAGIRSVVIVAVGAYRSSSDANDNLSLRLGSAHREAGSNNSSHSKTFETVHEFTS